MADSNSELIIIIPIVVALILLALLFAIPLLARRYCYDACDPEICGPCCDCTDFCLSCCKQVDNDRKKPDRNRKIREDYDKGPLPIVRPIIVEPEKNQLLPISQETDWNEKPSKTPETPQYVPPLSAGTSLSKLDYSMDTVSSVEPKVAEVKSNGNAVAPPETPFRGRGSIPETPQSAAPIYSKPSKKMHPIVPFPEEGPPLASGEEDAVSVQSSVFNKSTSSHHSIPQTRRPPAVREYKWSPRAGAPVISPKAGWQDQTESEYTVTKSYLEETSQSREASRLPRRFRNNGNDSLAIQSPHEESGNSKSSSYHSRNLSSYDTPSPPNENDDKNRNSHYRMYSEQTNGIRETSSSRVQEEVEENMQIAKAPTTPLKKKNEEEFIDKEVFSTRSYRDIYRPPFQPNKSKSPQGDISYSSSELSKDSEIGGYEGHGRDMTGMQNSRITTVARISSDLPSTTAQTSVVVREDGNRTIKTTTTRTTTAVRRNYETYEIEGERILSGERNLQEMKSFLMKDKNGEGGEVSEKLVVFESAAKSVTTDGKEESYVFEKGLKRDNLMGTDEKNYDMSYHEYSV